MVLRILEDLKLPVVLRISETMKLWGVFKVSETLKIFREAIDFFQEAMKK